MRTKPADRIPKDQLEARRLYQIKARNLRVGVWDPEKNCFWGIRRKFNDYYVDAEYDWDQEMYGTAYAVEKTDIVLPDDIVMRDIFEGNFCKNCGQPAEMRFFDEFGTFYDEPAKGRGRRDRHKEGVEDCGEQDPYLAGLVANDALYNFLKPIDEEYRA